MEATERMKHSKKIRVTKRDSERDRELETEISELENKKFN